MALVDFPKLFAQADNLRNDAKVDEAIKFYQEIAALADTPDERPERARALHMAGVSAKESVLDAQGSYYRDALNFFSQAEALYKKIPDPISLGALYRDWAIVNDYAGQADEAERYFHQSLLTLQPLKAPTHLGITNDKFGLHYYKQGDYPTAERYMRQALKVLRPEINGGFFTATTLYDLARVLFKLGRLDEATDLAKESLSWFAADHGATRYDRRIAQLNGFLSVVYYELGHHAAAAKAAQIYKTLVKTFDPLAAKVVQKDLEEVADGQKV